MKKGNNMAKKKAEVEETVQTVKGETKKVTRKKKEESEKKTAIKKPASKKLDKNLALLI